MTFKIKLAKLISDINIGMINRHIKIKHIFSKNLVPVLKLLIKEGLIFGFQISSNSKYFIIFLKFNKEHLAVKKLSLKSKVSNPKFLSKYELESLNYKNSYFSGVISSNKGLHLSMKPATKLVGGEYIFKID